MNVLVVQGLRLGAVEEIALFLATMEYVYENLYAFDLILGEAKRRHEELEEFRTSWRSTRRRQIRLRSVRRPPSIVLPEDKLRLERIRFESPGFWEFLGALNPLEVLRQYLQDRHERQRDREYRSAAEAERLSLENERLRTEIVRERLEILRGIGVPEEQIRNAVTRHLVAPLTRLDRFMDAQLIAGASLEERPDHPAERTV